LAIYWKSLLFTKIDAPTWWTTHRLSGTQQDI